MDDDSLNTDVLLAEVTDSATGPVMEFVEELDEWSPLLPEDCRHDRIFTPTPQGLSRSLMADELYVNMRVHKLLDHPAYEDKCVLLTVRACSQDGSVIFESFLTEYPSAGIKDYDDLQMGRSTQDKQMDEIMVGTSFECNSRELDYEYPQDEHTTEELVRVTENILDIMRDMTQKYDNMTTREICGESI